MKQRPAGVVITRSREGNQELAAKLRLAGLNPITVETISIAPPSSWTHVDRLLGRLDTFDWVAFTSPTGVKFFVARMKAISLRVPWKGSPRVAAVGEQTARALKDIGVTPDFIPSAYTTEALADELPAEKGTSVLLLRSDIADRGLSERLTDRGFSVQETAIYRTLVGKGPRPEIKDAGLIVFASGSAVRGFCALVPEDELRKLRKLKAVCIGPVTESAARKSGFSNTSKPGSYTIDAVVREVSRLSKENA